MKILSIRHPRYNEMELEWKKFRLTYEGGRPFIDEYLQSFSRREDSIEFRARRDASYCPAHAKTAVNEIKDAISERLVDVTRIGGSSTYQRAIDGINGGVDRYGSTMNGFISCNALPELLSMGKVGVYIDRPVLDENASLAETSNAAPYLYTYDAEDILAWNYDDSCDLESLLLRETVYSKDKDTGLPDGTKTRYRLLQKNDGTIKVTFYNESGVEQIADEIILNMGMIPFAVFEIAQSLMTDIADYQIALLNLGSSDLSYAIKANFPFYTEQFDPRDLINNMLQAGDVEDTNGDTVSAGTSKEANTAKNNEVKVGVAQGRRYPKGVDRPDFIHPSSEPLTASMTKQKDLQAEIRELVRLSVKSLASSSAEGKQEDNRSVESGLACIGSELEKGERQIANVWAEYEKDQPAIIKYPRNYTLRSDAERRAEVDALIDLMPKLPSDTLKKAIALQAAEILVGHRATREDMDNIQDEIFSSEVIITDPEVIRADQEAGLVSTQLASTLRGYPEGEVAQAKIDHEDRLARIAIAQSEASIANLNASRGVDDMSTDNNEASDEKKESRDNTEKDTVKDRTRGEGK